MKNFLLPVLMMMSMNGFANEKGNGGGAHFCAGRSSQEFYDVYEGKNRYDLTFDETPRPMDAVLEAAVKKVARRNLSLSRDLAKQLEFLRSSKNFRLSNFDLTLIPDADILMRDKGCEYRQLANWDDVTNTVFVDKEIFETLPPFHRTALFLHEAVYKIARVDLQMTDSNISRQFVAEILSNEPLTVDGKFERRGDILVRNSHSPLVSFGRELEWYDRMGTEDSFKVHLGIFSMAEDSAELRVTVQTNKTVNLKKEIARIRTSLFESRLKRSERLELEALLSKYQHNLEACSLLERPLYCQGEETRTIQLTGLKTGAQTLTYDPQTTNYSSVEYELFNYEVKVQLLINGTVVDEQRRALESGHGFKISFVGLSFELPN